MIPITLMLVDDHAIVREGLRAMLQSEPHLKIIAEANDGLQALEFLKIDRPRIILMDISMPNLDGLEATSRIKHLYPEITVIMLTMHRTESHVLQAIKAGASGYLLKESPRREVLDTIYAASSGEVLISASLLRSAMTYAMQPNAKSNLEIEALTPREHQALTLIANGNTNKEIAQQLEISPETVKKIVQNVIAKLHASDRTHAAVRAIKAGMI